jgi:hypothetical protein
MSDVLRAHGLLLGLSCAGAVVVFLGAAPSARADNPTGLVFGGKLGFGIGEPLNDSGGRVTAEVELGYVLPPLDHALELFAAFAYAAPSFEGSSTEPDPRLPGDGLVHYRVDQQLGALGVGLRYRLALPVVTPYVAAGGRLYMMRSEVSGDAGGEPFGKSEETGTAFGAFLAAGVELNLGPGALLGELQFAYAGVDTYVLGDTNIGGLGVMVGYRLMIPSPSSPSRSGDEVTETEPYEVAASSGAQPPVAEQAAAGPYREPAPAEATAPASAVDAQEAAPAAVAAADAPAELEKAQVRGHIRSFSGQPLRATITLKPGGLKASTDAQGYFMLEVAPGRYSVRLRSFGYVSQTRQILVEENGVTVLNVELGKK